MSAVFEVTINGAGACVEDILSSESAVLREVAEVAGADKFILVDEDGVLCIAKDGDLAVFVRKGLQRVVLSHEKRTALSGLCSTFARIRGRRW